MKEVRLPADAATICFVTNAQIQKWNAVYRGKNNATDVLSFPNDEVTAPANGASPEKKTTRKGKGFSPTSFTSSTSSTALYLGDIAIAPAVARANARLYGRTFDQELRILILHGILHLMGYDHETDTGQMERREQRLRRKLEIA
jgi:probable rRNA maturation factor